ncbi:MAG: glutamine amidotransferase [Candidatus Limnocylindrales bacterium]
MDAARRVLIAGETWISYGVHLKGFAPYTTGFYAEGLRGFVAALEDHGHTVTHVPNHLAPTTFPASIDELKSYDVVILSDIPADTLLLHPDTFERGLRTPDRLALLAAWVAEGGGLLMIGGYMSFSGFEGKARYQHTALAEILPVQMLGFDDRIECPSGVIPKVILGHPVLEGVDRDWPYLLGYNRVTAKPGTDTLIKVGGAGDPLLVLSGMGRGRTAAFTSDCSPHWGSPAFTEWPSYQKFWGQLIHWLGGGAQAISDP